MGESTNIPAPTANPGAPPREDMGVLLRDWGRYVTGAVDGAEDLARKKPLAAILLAFLAGVLFNALMGALFRRRD